MHQIWWQQLVPGYKCSLRRNVRDVQSAYSVKTYICHHTQILVLRECVERPKDALRKIQESRGAEKSWSGDQQRQLHVGSETEKENSDACTHDISHRSCEYVIFLKVER
jgi:hypothetical protein